MIKPIRSILLASICALLFSLNGYTQSIPQAFKGAQIIPISGEPINNGVLIVENGTITTVGGASTNIPSDANVHNVSGKVIMPGLVDTHSHIGEGDGGDRSSALHPDVRIMDTIDPRSDTFRKALAGGITSVNVMPGSGHLMSGQTVYLKLRPANTIEDMLLVIDEEENIYGGMKMANGTNPIGNPPFPGTRAKSAALVRSLFVKAREYQAKIDAAGGDESKMPPRDIGMEALVQVLEGKRTVHNHTHRHDDILTAIRLSQEFGYDLVLQHVSEAWKVADEIAEAGVPASIITLDSFGGKLEAVDLKNANGKYLEDAGVMVGLHTDDGITDSRLFLRSAALAIREGMSRKGALESLTIANAKMMRIDDRVGTLEKGKDADFIILSGDPFSVYTHVEQTWIEGHNVWNRANEEDRKFATGGYEVFRGEVHTHHTDGGSQ
ncbi:MAG: amidohydrolase family protein [Balneolaceae bacterium]|nr:amidohydrolase family protein [Balneolaceae bacterium]